MSSGPLEPWPALVSAAHVVAAIAVTVDAVLRKRHVPSVIGWVGLAWLAPLVGSVLYLCFGINRIHRTASALRLQAAWSEAGDGQLPAGAREVSPEHIGRPGFAGLARLGERLTGQPLLGGNRIEPLRDGDEAYPAMLAAIEAAHTSITLLTYIFDSDAAGMRFLDALARARARGVAVRVLIDDVGARYSRSSMLRLLRKANVPVASFLPTRLSPRFRYANLRNHRKILVVDGTVGFTGGMNIRHGHCLAERPSSPVRCLHFRVTGPVVADLQRTFAVDWAFVTAEHLGGPQWFAALEPAGTAIARGVPDGPDADLDNILHLVLGALAAATRHVRIVTPYFLPEGGLLRAIQVAAMRGVHVDILLPARSNVPLVDWAMAPQLPWLLRSGCRVWLAGPVFDHTKLLVIDGYWSLIGSTNWDARSMRLNFEYNVECYDEALAQRLDALIDGKLAAARAVTLQEVAALGIARRLRNGLARLLSPYL